jgi:acetamidase/formamidase
MDMLHRATEVPICSCTSSKIAVFLTNTSEVCGTAIETSMNVTVRLTVLKDHSHVDAPHFTSSVSSNSETYYSTTGVGPEILEATRDAVRGMIKTLNVQQGLTDLEAYMLCSVAGDLRLHEVVSRLSFPLGRMT